MQLKTLVPCLVIISLAVVVQGTKKYPPRPRPSVNLSLSPTCAFVGDKINLKCTTKNFYYPRTLFIHNGKLFGYYSKPSLGVRYKKPGTRTWQCKAFNRVYKMFSPKRKVHIIEKPVYQPKCTQAAKYIVLNTKATWQGANNLCKCLGYRLWVPATPDELQCVCEDILNDPNLAKEFFWLAGMKKEKGKGFNAGHGQKLLDFFPVETQDKEGKCLSMMFDKFYVSDCSKKYKIICEKGRK